jgi:hypothetical protein
MRGRMGEDAAYFLRLGLLGFGGPVALVGLASLAVLFRSKVNNPLLIAATAAVRAMTGFGSSWKWCTGGLTAAFR